MTTLLAIETSCDETAAAVILNGRTILSNVVATQIELHSRFGGIFPEIASRQHVLSIYPVIKQALDEAGISSVQSLDGIAVTHGPGLSGSLLVGVNAAKGISFASGIPLLAVNHLEGHIYSNWIETSDPGEEKISDEDFPLLVLIVSGGHTELILMEGHGSYCKLGGTLDDAAGEAFDKIARLLDLGFPGGPAIQRAAESGDCTRFVLPHPLKNSREHRFNFSFSGLKTAVINLVRRLEHEGVQVDEPQLKADLAASFQQVMTAILVEKAIDAATANQVKRICVCGGVSANGRLREALLTKSSIMGIPLTIPPLALCTDNAAMIGAAAHFRWQHSPSFAGDLSVDVFANLPLPHP